MSIPKIIVTDLDNTLLNKRRVTDYTEKVLQQCQDYGIIVCYASARPLRVIKSLCRKFTPNYIIADNGAVICANNIVIQTKYIDINISKKILEYLNTNDDVTFFSAENGEKLYVSKFLCDMDKFWNAEKADFNELTDLRLTKLTFECQNDFTVKNIIRLFPELEIHKVSRRFDQEIVRYHILKKNASKDEGLNCILQILNLNYSDVIAFGDDMTDLKLIKNANVGVAVKNAIDIVRYYADEICDNCNENGVAKYIEVTILPLIN